VRAGPGIVLVRRVTGVEDLILELAGGVPLLRHAMDEEAITELSAAFDVQVTEIEHALDLSRARPGHPRVNDAVTTLRHAVTVCRVDARDADLLVRPQQLVDALRTLGSAGFTGPEPAHRQGWGPWTDRQLAPDNLAAVRAVAYAADERQRTAPAICATAACIRSDVYLPAARDRCHRGHLAGGRSRLSTGTSR
jgi:hypothetical protein